MEDDLTKSRTIAGLIAATEKRFERLSAKSSEDDEQSDERQRALDMLDGVVAPLQVIVPREILDEVRNELRTIDSADGDLDKPEILRTLLAGKGRVFFSLCEDLTVDGNVPLDAPVLVAIRCHVDEMDVLVDAIAIPDPEIDVDDDYLDACTEMSARLVFTPLEDGQPHSIEFERDPLYGSKTDAEFARQLPIRLALLIARVQAHDARLLAVS